MWRAATGSDVPALEAQFRTYLETSMFLLGSLEAYGLEGDTDHACRYWWFDRPERGVFARSRSGMVLMQAPGVDVTTWRAAGGLLAGRSVTGIIGEAGQVATFRQAVAWLGEISLLQDEPGYVLELADLRLPEDLGALPPSPDGDPPGGILDAKKLWALRPLSDVPRDLAVAWREAYVLETGMAAPHRAQAQAEREVASYLERDTHRVLMRDGTPVGMPGINTRVGDAVQVGGVWTPPEVRGQGIARRAVALHLAELRGKGARRAVLFAASPMAARVYEAIGFQRSFTFGWCLYADPITVPA